jgi:hypothetical protein
MKKRAGKKGIVSDYLPWLLIALAVLVISGISVLIIKGTGIGFIEKLKNIFRGG